MRPYCGHLKGKAALLVQGQGHYLIGRFPIPILSHCRPSVECNITDPTSGKPCHRGYCIVMIHENLFTCVHRGIHISSFYKNYNNIFMYNVFTYSQTKKCTTYICYYAYFSNGFARCFLGSIESNFFLIS